MHHAPQVRDLRFQALRLRPLALPVALHEPRAVQGHRHLRGQRVEQAPVRALERHAGGGDLDQDAPQTALLVQERQRAARGLLGSLGSAPGVGHERALAGRPLHQGQVRLRHPQGLRAPVHALQPAQQLEPSAAAAFEDAGTARVQRLEQPLGEQARQLRRLGGRRHHRHRIQQQPHVPVVLRLVPGEDPLETVEAAGVLDVRTLLPQAHAPGVAAAGGAQRLVRPADQLLGRQRLAGIGHRHARAELQAQRAFVVPVLGQAAHHVLRHPAAFVGARIEEEAGEGGAAVPRDVVLAAQARAQHRGDLAQHLVAEAPVQPLVHPAEIVGTEQQQGDRPALLRGWRQRRLQLRLEVRAVRQLRDLVEQVAGHAAGVDGEGGRQSQEALPPRLLAQGIHRGGEPQQVTAVALAAGKTQADPDGQVPRGAPASLRGGILSSPAGRAKRDAVETPSGDLLGRHTAASWTGCAAQAACRMAAAASSASSATGSRLPSLMKISRSPAAPGGTYNETDAAPLKRPTRRT